MSRLIKELASENGTLEFLEQDGRLVGLVPTGAGKSVNTGFCMRRTHTPVKMGEKPWNMARLTNIGALLAAFGLKQAEQQGEEKRILTLGIRMNDPILEMNNGEFVWTIGETGSSLKAAETGAGYLRLHGKCFHMAGDEAGRAGELAVWLPESGRNLGRTA